MPADLSDAGELLFREEADPTIQGIVALLDGRIARRGYGATLLGSLPPTCPRTESLADVAEFWSHLRARARPPATTAASAAAAQVFATARPVEG